MDKDWEEKVNEPAQELGADLFKRLDAQEIVAQFLEALGLTHTPHQSSISPTILSHLTDEWSAQASNTGRLGLVEYGEATLHQHIA